MQEKEMDRALPARTWSRNAAESSCGRLPSAGHVRSTADGEKRAEELGVDVVDHDGRCELDCRAQPDPRWRRVEMWIWESAGPGCNA
jgi:hypothetical protein